MSLDKRNITKKIVTTVATAMTGSLITKALLAQVPSTQNFKTAEVVGTVGGWMIGEKLQPFTDKMVDDFFDKREAKVIHTLNK